MTINTTTASLFLGGQWVISEGGGFQEVRNVITGVLRVLAGERAIGAV